MMRDPREMPFRYQISLKSRCNVNVTFGVNPNGVDSWYDGSFTYLYVGDCLNGSAINCMEIGFKDFCVF